SPSTGRGAALGRSPCRCELRAIEIFESADHPFERVAQCDLVTRRTAESEGSIGIEDQLFNRRGEIRGFGGCDVAAGKTILYYIEETPQNADVYRPACCHWISTQL